MSNSHDRGGGGGGRHELRYLVTPASFVANLPNMAEQQLRPDLLSVGPLGRDLTDHVDHRFKF